MIKYLEEQHEKDRITGEQKNIFQAMIDESIEAERKKKEQEQKNLIKGMTSYAIEKNQ